MQHEPDNQVIWRPDPCRMYQCREGKELCSIYGCPGYLRGLDPCLGSLVTKVGYRPYVCYPRSKFGIPDRVSRGCQQEEVLLLHHTKRKDLHWGNHGAKYDKVRNRQNGKKFCCEEVRRNRCVSFTGPKCKPFTRIAYCDVRYCRAVEDDTLERAEGCDRFISVPGQLTAGEPGEPGTPGPC